MTGDVDMTPDFITGFFMEALKIAMMLAAPMLLAGLLVGFACEHVSSGHANQ
jgi:flagellar biosynthesis protein FliQ